ncbi:MAG: VWA domain-containing protein [Nitrososphaeraceae archaeon]
MGILQNQDSDNAGNNVLNEIQYFLINKGNDNFRNSKVRLKAGIKKEDLDRYMRLIEREVLRERTPDLQELAQSLENMEHNEYSQKHDNLRSSQLQNPSQVSRSGPTVMSTGASIITELIERGYLKDSLRWLTPRAFFTIGERILMDIMNPLKYGEIGLHETMTEGLGSLVLDSTKKFEHGNDLRMINVPKSLLNTLQRNAKGDRLIQLPLEVDIEDFEEYETSHDVRVSLVYCIDLSSTMRYSSMFGDLSRIEAAKKALWGLFIFNKKFFPSDSISVIGFGALASRISPNDIPYLKTFEPGGDFMHYTNYQAALRLASKILIREGSPNKRIVLITDGHPSACFIDNQKDYIDLTSQKPYSHFYSPDKDTLQRINIDQNLKLDLHSGKLVYLCYRYRQVDEYIGMRTIAEAKKCWHKKIQIDTIMISEEDSLLDYVNQMEKSVRGKSYYINPGNIDKALITDYLNNRRTIMRS